MKGYLDSGGYDSSKKACAYLLNKTAGRDFKFKDSVPCDSIFKRALNYIVSKTVSGLVFRSFKDHKDAKKYLEC